MQIDLRSDFTLDELLNVLKAQEQTEGSGFHTRCEWQEVLGVTGYKIAQLLHLAMQNGILLRAKHQREGIDGMWRPTQVYAFAVEKVSENET